MKNVKSDQLILRFGLLMVGLLIMSFGIVMYLKAGLGANPLTTFTNGFSKTFGFSVGNSSQIIMLITMIFIFFIDRRRIGIGTIINAIFTGVFIDLFMGLNIHSGSLIQNILILTVGVITFAIGLAMYVMAGLGEGAIDAIMIILQDKFHLDIKKSRMILDIGLVIVGIILGGGVGIGTIVGTIATGPIMGRTMNFIKTYIIRGKMK